MEILELKNTISEIKNSLDILNSQMELTQERINELEDRATENIKENDKEKKKILNEQSQGPITCYQNSLLYVWKEWGCYIFIFSPS